MPPPEDPPLHEPDGEPKGRRGQHESTDAPGPSAVDGTHHSPSVRRNWLTASPMRTPSAVAPPVSQLAQGRQDVRRHFF